MGLLDGARAPQRGWESGLASPLRASFPQLLELSMSHEVSSAHGELRLSCTPQCPLSRILSQDDKHLALQGKALKVRGDAVGLCLAHCRLRGSRALPRSL